MRIFNEILGYLALVLLPMCMSTVKGLQVFVGDETMPSFEQNSPHYTWSNGSYAFRAPVYFPSEAELLHCNLSLSAEGHIAFVLSIQTECWFPGWARQCEESNCSGVVSVLFDEVSEIGWETYHVGPLLDPLYTLKPMLAMSGANHHGEWLQSQSRESPRGLEAFIQSGEFNDAEYLFQSWFFKAMNSIGALHCAVVMATCCYKLTQLVLSRNHIRVVVRMVLIPELMANGPRCAVFLNFVLEMRWLPWRIWRTLVQVSISLSIASTAAIAFMMYSVYKNTMMRSSGPQRKSRRLSKLCKMLCSFSYSQM